MTCKHITESPDVKHKACSMCAIGEELVRCNNYNNQPECEQYGPDEKVDIINYKEHECSGADPCFKITTDKPISEATEKYFNDVAKDICKNCKDRGVDKMLKEETHKRLQEVALYGHSISDEKAFEEKIKRAMQDDA